MNYPVKMYEYHVWANQAIFNRLLELPGELYNQKITSIFPTVSEALIHIYTADLGWINILSGMDMKQALTEAFQLREELESISLEDLNLRFIELSERFTAFLGQNPDLERIIRLDNPYAGIRDTRLSEIILHVVNHGTYHRGNIAAMMRQLGSSSAMTDYAFFWYQSEPELVLPK
ncbi:damage-inducible protein DinB [Paenibacillus sp. LC231]|uniref:DinB family protein n=1 Tax=Paenibacillus sp. LC231 TaxID=1120679 RepID=UPI0008DCA5C5|nr:DinB family protein [Paenibacillus sp. LC231]OIB03300.1 damage-inducible protein DinB [Paenibacillus sp. LC231]